MRDGVVTFHILTFTMERERRGLVMGFAFPFLIFTMETGVAFTFRRQTPWMGDIFHAFTFDIFTF